MERSHDVSDSQGQSCGTCRLCGTVFLYFDHDPLLQAQLGSLNQIKRLVKTLGMVNSAHGFNQQPEVCIAVASSVSV